MADELTKAIQEIMAKRHTIEDPRSEEEAWNEYVKQQFPLPAYVGTAAHVDKKTKQFVDSDQSLVIFGQDLKPIDSTFPLYGDDGRWTKEFKQLMKKHNLKSRQITFGISNDVVIAHMYTKFWLEKCFELKFMKPSSKEFNDFVEWADKINDEETEKKRYKDI